MSKIVCFPIRVPSGPLCWDWLFNGEVCEHFDNEGGHPTCQLKLGSLWDNRTKDGIRKAKECLWLKEQKDNG